jgi:hypothetical protein
LPLPHTYDGDPEISLERDNAAIPCYDAQLPEGVSDNDWFRAVRGLMANDISFLYPLSPELQDRLSVRATKKQWNISNVVVQYEALIANR